MSDSVSILAECRKCGARFEVSGTSGTTHFRQEYKCEDGRSILLTYYDCPKCGMRHFVQVDDAASIRMLSEEATIFARIAIANSKGKKIPVKMQEKYKKKKGHLCRYRTKLMTELSGKTVTEVSTGQQVVLEFSV